MKPSPAIAALMLLTAVPVSAPALAQPVPPQPAPAPAAADFTVGDQHFTPADILDARAIPDLEGSPVIMITFNDAGVAKLAEATREGNSGRTIMIPIAIDGQPLTDIVTTEVRADPVLTFTARGRSIAQATALAKRISGRDPLPEDLAE